MLVVLGDNIVNYQPYSKPGAFSKSLVQIYAIYRDKYLYIMWNYYPDFSLPPNAWTLSFRHIFIIIFIRASWLSQNGNHTGS